MKAKVLLVEDDENLGFVIKDNLEMHQYSVELYTDGKTGINAFLNNHYDICILDIMLPVLDGISMSQEIRRHNTLIPVIFLTAKSMKEDKIAGFRAGADDYITKPFSIEELILRMEVFLRRSKNVVVAPVSHIYTIGKYEFDYRNLSLKFNKSIVRLTQMEADILKMLLVNKDRILRREEILNEVWGDDDYFMGRSMDVFISKLRKYLSKDSDIQIINIHGIGFRLQIEEKE